MKPASPGAFPGSARLADGLATVARSIDETRIRGTDAWLPWLAAALAIAALAFLPLGLAILRDGGPLSIDVELMRMVAAIRSDRLDGFFAGVEALQAPVVTSVIAAGAIAFLGARRWRDAVTILAVIPGGMLANLGGKALFHRERPGLSRLAAAHGYGFPSGHAVAATVVCLYLLMAVFLVTRNRVIRASALVAALAVVGSVALSRVYLRVHYPTDVIGGILGAIAWATGCVLVIRALERGMGGAKQRRSAAESGAAGS